MASEVSDPSRDRRSAAPFTDGYAPGEPGLRRISVALFAAGLATFALLYSTQPLLPELVRAFAITPGQSVLSVSLCTLGLGLALLFAGPLSEVVGRTGLMHASLIASSATALLGAVAPTWPTLLALRAVEGVLLAGLPAVAMAYLHEEVQPAHHARAAGLYIGGTAIGGMTGRLVAGGVGDLAGWRWGVAAVAVLGCGCAALVWWLLPASRNFHASPAEPRQLVSMTGRLLRDPALLALFAISATMMGAFVAVYNAMGFRLTSSAYGLSVGVAGLVFCVYPVGTLTSTYAGRLADRYGRRAVVPPACVLTLVGLGLTAFAPLPLVVTGLAVMTAGFFAVHGVASGWAAARAQVGSGATAQAASLYLFAYYLGSSVFGGLAGTAWASGGWPAVMVLAGALMLIAFAVSLALRRMPSLRERQGSGSFAG